MNDYPKRQMNLTVDDYIYNYIKILSTVEQLPMNVILTVMIEDSMNENAELCRKYSDFIHKNRQSK